MPTPKQERPRSPRWATIKEISEHFCVSEPLVREGRGVFARLRRVKLTDNRVVVLRSDFERLDREMERAAVAIEDAPPDVAHIDDRRKTA